MAERTGTPTSSESVPLVSIVTATYNRSNVLRWTIRSVLGQTHTDWQLLVVGDACTDDTAEVVSSFADPRISFVDLPVNCGDQSGPNNEGVRRAAGRYVAFLNHDDLWFPDHLSRCLGAIRRTDADLVFSLAELVQRAGARRVGGLFENGRYRPGAFVPASSWLFERSLSDRVGPWRHHTAIRNIPSRDWLFRAWRSGARIEVVPHLTTVTFGSGHRPGSYVRRDEDEQRTYFGRIEEDPRAREEALLAILVNLPAQLKRSIPYLSTVSPRRLLRALLYRLEDPVLLRVGVDPSAFYAWRTGRPKGAFVRRLREVRGLDGVPERRPE